MKGYIDKNLLKYGHTKPTHPQLIPHKHQEIKYGDKQQLSSMDEKRPALDTKGVKGIQVIIVVLLYYVRAVNNNLLVALSAIGAQQAAAAEDTSDTIKQLPDYVATYPNYGFFIAQATWFLQTTLMQAFKMNPRDAAAQDPTSFYWRMTLNPYGMELSSPLPRLLNCS